MRDEERLGPHFDLAQMLDVRERAHAAVQKIGAGLGPGMSEDEAGRMARDVLKGEGMLRGWHGVFVRFGANTLKFYGEPSEPGVVLQDTDIAIVDIGPVWQKWEGDAGDTFVFGQDAEMHRAKADVHAIFDVVAAKWRADRLSGETLYGFAEAEAAARGWELNLDLGGHRLADFPHALIHRGMLVEADFAPQPNLWVLEIHIRHPDRPFGAFYEDMLLP